MKLPFHFSRHAAALAGLLMISACGQRGPLYMPNIPPAAPAATTVPTAPATATGNEGKVTPPPASPSK